MAHLTPDEIEESLRLYGFSAPPEFVQKTLCYIDLLLRWNTKISLTSITTPRDIVRFHFGESLLAISVAEIHGGRLADVGSGAGFPGVPLAMAAPNLNVTLIESNSKKAAFLTEVRCVLRQTNFEVHCGRAESVGENEEFDLITARAVGRHTTLLSWAKEHMALGGRVLMWLGKEDVTVLVGAEGWGWQPAVHIPGTANRFILVGCPTS